MALSFDAMARKDASTRATMEHRHFATIAAIIAMVRETDSMRSEIAWHFAAELRHTNPRFDRARFLRACGVQS